MSHLSPSAQSFLEKIKNSFFGRWIVNYRVSFLLIILIIFYGLYVAFTIPKESSPDIKFGIVNVTTVYPGANPVDIDDIITEKIEDKVKDIDGIDKIESSSSLGVSSVTITLDNGIDVNDFMTDAKGHIDTISFPDDVRDPSVVEISTANEVLFQMILYGPKKDFSMNHLRSLAMKFKDDVKGKGGIIDVGIDASIGGGPGGGGGAGGSSDSDFDMQVQLDQTKLEGYGLTVSQIIGQIRAYNQNLPLGNYKLGDLRYDYRIDNELSSLADLQNIPIAIPGGSIKLQEIAKIVRSYKSKSISYGGIDTADNHAISLVIYKKSRSNVFADSTSARKVIDETLQKLPYTNLKSAYTTDLADVIIDDYTSLGRNGITSVFLVFLITTVFIGFRQSAIATLSMPISFFITFMVLNYLGMTMNFMVNFSLILSFGMGIDTVIVFIESARENMKKGYNPTSAILITMNTYARPNIITSLINIVVFIPMLVLPGIVGKFLSFIPITLFATLLASLFLALTVNGALFARFNKKLDYYYNDDEHDESLAIMSPEEKEILYHEREGKKSVPLTDAPWLEKRIDDVREYYVSILRFILARSFWRKVVILGPIGLVFATLFILAPSIGFKLFPSGDNPNIDFELTARQGTDVSKMAEIMSGVDLFVSQIPELKSYTIDIANTKASIGLSLVKKEERTRDSFAIQAEVESGLAYLKTQGYKFEGKVQAGGPPTGKAIGVKLIANDKKLLTTLKQVSKDFEDYLGGLTGTINISNSSTDSPGQFSFTFDRERLSDLGLTPSDLQSEIYSSINGIKAGTMMIDTKERDIVLKLNTFTDDVSPEMLYNLVLTTKVGQIRLSDVAIVNTDPSLTSIKRVDGDIVISVEADLDQGLQPTNFQPKLEEFAKNYKYPSGISYKAGGENEANADLIQGAMIAFVVALFMTFVLLVYMFNSFSKPAIVLYSIFTALLGVNIGLWVTGNPYSMAFAIGFISLIGVIVNTAIFLVDRINENTKKGVGLIESIIESGQARFKPIVISTLTTVLGLASSVTQDEFYAGLGYTVIFGLVFSSVITLVAIPVIVKDLKLILNIMIRILARFVFTILPSLLIYIICYILDYHILGLVLGALIFFIMSYLYLYSIKSKRMNIIQESLGYYIDTGETVVSNNKLILRYLISLLNIIPFYLIIDVMYSFFNNRGQFIADSIFGTKAVFLTNYSFSGVDEEDYEAPILYDNISISPTIIPLWKFVLYSILTLGIYEMIRFYRHWRRIKKEKKINILCFRRAVFAGLFASSMVKHIQTLVKKEGIDYDGYPIVVGISYFFLRASRLFSSLPMLGMVSVMNKYWSLSDNLKGKTSKEVIKSKRGA